MNRRTFVVSVAAASVATIIPDSVVHALQPKDFDSMVLDFLVDQAKKPEMVQKWHDRIVIFKGFSDRPLHLKVGVFLEAEYVPNDGIYSKSIFRAQYKPLEPEELAIIRVTEGPRAADYWEGKNSKRLIRHHCY